MILIFLTVCLLLLAVFTFSWYRYRKMIYFHVPLHQGLIKKYPLKYETIRLKTKDNISIHTWYFKVKNPKAVLILIHGFTLKQGGKSLMLPHADYLVKNNYSVIIPDLRSVGESGGDKICLGIKEWQEVEAAHDYVKALKENKGKKIGFFGISMGASTAIIAAAKTGKGDFIIASVPFASYDNQFKLEIQHSKLPLWFFYPVIKLIAFLEFGNYSLYDPANMIKQVHKPILIFGAKQDKDIAYADEKLVYAKANKPKLFWSADTQHDIFDENPEEFKKRVFSFLSKTIS